MSSPTGDRGDELEDDHLMPGDIYGEDAAPLGDVTGCIEDAAHVDMKLDGGIDNDVDVSIIPVREPSTPQDVTVAFSIGDFGSVQLSLAKDEVLALCDQLHQALEVPQFDE